jgi:hypothetical protein
MCEKYFSFHFQGVDTFLNFKTLKFLNILILKFLTKQKIS